MLPRPLRLQNAIDIAKVFREGRRRECGPVFVVVRPTSRPLSRFGALATKKVFPLATERTEAKRIAREAIRSVSSRVRPGYDILVVYRARPNTRNVARFSQALEQMLGQQGLLL